VASLARALRDFQQGVSSESELFQQLDLVLSDGRTQRASLLDTLESQHRSNPLPDDLRDRLRVRIEETATDEAEELDATEMATSLIGASEGVTEAATVPVQPSSSSPFSSSSSPPAGARKSLPGPGDTLGDRFILEELIGQGGMSRVFRATDKFKVKGSSRTPEVAIKLMDSSGLTEDSAFMVVQREVQKLQALGHPNIVRVIEGYQDDSGALFITMEYLDGQPLSQKISALGRDTMPVEQAMGYIREMGSALQFAHSKRIVHADFKPSNAFITSDEQLKVIDFGIARAFSRPDDHPDDMTVFDPRALGALTPAYASPEMIEGREPDPCDDVYSLGCVSYELLAGRHPFSRTRSTQARDAQMTPTRPACLNRRQWRALQSALAFDRTHRTASVDEFMEGLLPRQSRSAPWLAVGMSVAIAGVIAITGLFWPEPTPVVTPPAPSVVPAQPDPIPVEDVPQPFEPLPEPGTAIEDCDACPRMVVLPEGTATIGAQLTEGTYEFETPERSITISRVFAMGESEVTVGQFRAFLDATGRRMSGCRTVADNWEGNPELSWRNPGFDQTEEHPVSCVSWRDAQDYVSWLSELTQQHYQLPSETEWEYAARAGRTPWATQHDACRQANVADRSTSADYPGLAIFGCDDGFAHTAPVMSNPANEFGLYDMRGNLFEWNEDCWNPGYVGAPSDASARASGDCDQHVLRGGSWFTAPGEQRMTYRNRHPASYRSNTFGFRVVRELKQ
jgi:formylglycine-generating enzyme required for sulfatase activity